MRLLEYSQLAWLRLYSYKNNNSADYYDGELIEVTETNEKATK